MPNPESERIGPSTPSARAGRRARRRAVAARRLVVGIALLAGGAVPGHAQTGRGVAVDSVFADLDRTDGPGCAVSVTRDARPVHTAGYGMANLEYDIPITPSSVFHAASVSKQFTALAVALLVDEGRVSWDDDIRSYVPELPELGHTITLEHLVHHTSGIRDQWELLIMAGWRWEADLVRQADVLDLLRRQRALNFEPGAEHLYSNSGFTLLAVLVERVTGTSLREFADSRIFAPLGMDRTHFHDDHQTVVPGRAYGYAPDEDEGWKISIPDFAIVGASSLFTTVEDMVKWERNFHTAEVGGREVVDGMLHRTELNDGREIDYAHALIHGEHRGLRTIGHGGADAGYRSGFIRYPDQGLAVAVLCNDPASRPGRRARRVASVYLEDAFTEPPATPAGGTDGPAAANGTSRRGARVTARRLRELEGWYVEPATDVPVRIHMDQGRLELGSGLRPGRALVPIDRSTFRIAGSDEEARFDRDGRTLELRLVRDGHERRLRRDDPVDTSPGGLSHYVGWYWSDELGVFYEVRRMDDRLVFWNRKRGAMPAGPMHRDGFSVYMDFMAATFQRDDDGAVTGLTLSSPRTRKVRFRRVDGPRP